MEATTTRASTVIKSMPTSEMRTQASMTIPLSSTRSRTSIKLDPPETLSTAIRRPPSLESNRSLRPFYACRGLAWPRRPRGRWRTGQLRPARHGLGRRSGKIRIVFPPVEADGFGLINRADQQANADRQQLNIGQRNADVTRDHKSFVENPIENVQQIGCSGNSRNSLHNISGKYRRSPGTGNPCNPR